MFEAAEDEQCGNERQAHGVGTDDFPNDEAAGKTENDEQYAAKFGEDEEITIVDGLDKAKFVDLFIEFDRVLTGVDAEQRRLLEKLPGLRVLCGAFGE